MMKRIKIKLLFPAFLVLITMLTSCEDLIEVDRPRNQLISATVFEDDLTAVAAISGLIVSASGSYTSATYLNALSADELMIEQGDWVQFYQNEIQSVDPSVFANWKGAFGLISRANSCIEGLEKSEKVTAALKNQLLGEAKFVRAFFHFYLVNLFGDVPYITTTDWMVNGLVSRMPVSDVYDKIIIDLLEAKSLLAEDYSYSQNERVRPNKWVATALLARVYLYQEDWIPAEEQATTVINNTSLYSLNSDLNKVFLKNSSEAILQVIPPFPLKFTTEGSIFQTTYSPTTATLTAGLFNAFETNDSRKAAWIGLGASGGITWYYPRKYKENSVTGTGAEYYMIFRLAEQYLIRAEARAKLNKLTGPNSAESDINIIRDRAGLPPTTAVTQQELLDAIEQERRVELFIEWGHRWMDLKRTGRAAAVLSPIKPNWNNTDVLYPIPYSELQLNPNMTQNDGY